MIFDHKTLRSAAIAAALTLLSPFAAYAESPFAALAGTWSGSGIAQFDGGQTESLRCKGYYTDTGGPQNLGLSIRCANASAKVELRATLVDSNGAISGNWEERTYNQSGTIAGSATADKLSLTITGGITGSMEVTVAGATQSVSVITSGPTLKGVTVTLSR